MEQARMNEIALLLQEWRWRQLGTERYMGELKAAAEDLNIPDQEMETFCLSIGERMLKRNRNTST